MHLPFSHRRPKSVNTKYISRFKLFLSKIIFPSHLSDVRDIIFEYIVVPKKKLGLRLGFNGIFLGPQFLAMLPPNPGYAHPPSPHAGPRAPRVACAHGPPVRTRLRVRRGMETDGVFRCCGHTCDVDSWLALTGLWWWCCVSAQKPSEQMRAPLACFFCTNARVNTRAGERAGAAAERGGGRPAPGAGTCFEALSLADATRGAVPAGAACRGGSV